MTLTFGPTAFWMPVIGQIVLELVTVPLPPPASSTPAPPSVPITAIDSLPFGLSGRMPLFFSRTVPSSPSCSAVCWCAAEVTVAEREPVCGLSNMPKANIWVRIRATFALSVAWLSVPAVRAADRSLASENGIAMSMPPSVDGDAGVVGAPVGGDEAAVVRLLVEAVLQHVGVLRRRRRC